MNFEPSLLSVSDSDDVRAKMVIVLSLILPFSGKHAHMPINTATARKCCVNTGYFVVPGFLNA